MLEVTQLVRDRASTQAREVQPQSPCSYLHPPYYVAFVYKERKERNSRQDPVREFSEIEKVTVNGTVGHLSPHMKPTVPRQRRVREKYH